MERQIEEYLERMHSYKPQMVLEAKLGTYKVFDQGLMSLLKEDGLVTDEVVKLCSYFM